MCGNDIQAKTEQDALTPFIKSRKPVTNKFKIKKFMVIKVTYSQQKDEAIFTL